LDGDDTAATIKGSGSARFISNAFPASNFLRIVVIEDVGWLFVNGKFVTVLDLRDFDGAAEVSLINSMFEGDGMQGASTDYSIAKVTNWRQNIGPRSGVIIRKEGFIGSTEVLAHPDDFYVTSTFINPSPEVSLNQIWTYGFAYRSFDFGYGYFTFVSSNGQFYHYRGQGLTSNLFRQDRESLPTKVGFSTNTGDQTKISVIAIAGAGLLIVNDVLVAEITLAANLDSGSFWAIAGFNVGEQIRGPGTEYENLSIWSR